LVLQTILGGSDGIGYETALELARRGARVIVASRQRSKGENAIQRIVGQLVSHSYALQKYFYVGK
jgi:NAD(P)-dependent dehydrogenase (short-subunit alcohol dehydrogenase family)